MSDTGDHTSRVRVVDISELLEEEGIDPECVSDYKLHENGELAMIVERTAFDADLKKFPKP